MSDNDTPAVKVGMEILASMNHEFHEAPDRLIAIVGAAYLDLMLDQLIRATLIEDDKEVEKLVGVYGPLGSNGTRCRVAYCLGLISAKERDDLAAVAKIRNAFAHRFEVRSFDHEKPSEFIAKLHTGKQLDSIVKDLLANSRDQLEHEALRKIAASGRHKFRETVFNLFGILLRKLDAVVRASEATWYPNDNANA